MVVGVYIIDSVFDKAITFGHATPNTDATSGELTRIKQAKRVYEGAPASL
jgi:hypothetical protein